MKRLWQQKLFVRLFVIFGIGFGLVFLFQQINLQGSDLVDALKRFNLRYLLLALAIVSIQILFQITRLWVLCSQAAGVTWHQAARAYVSGQFIGNFVLSQAGHAVKIAFLRKDQDDRGRKIDTAEATAIILVDKVLDVGILVILTLGSALQVSVALPQVQGWEKGIIVGLGFPFLGLAILRFLRFLRQRSPRVHQWFQEFKAGLTAVRHPRQIRNAVVMDVGDWLTEALLLQVLCVAQGYPLSLPQLILCLFVLNIGLSVPTSMANLGTYEAALAFPLNGMGIPLAKSVVIATLFHGLQMLGIAVWMMVHQSNVSHWWPFQKQTSVMPASIQKERSKVASK